MKKRSNHGGQFKLTHFSKHKRYMDMVEKAPMNELAVEAIASNSELIKILQS